MAYASPDVHSAAFLAGNIIYQATQRLFDAENDGDLDVLNDAAPLMDVVTSYFTESDPVFLAEMEKITAARKAAKVKGEDGRVYPYEPGFDKAMDADFRFKELKAMFRSMCRVGKFTRIESPSATWEPKV